MAATVQYVQPIQYAGQFQQQAAPPPPYSPYNQQAAVPATMYVQQQQPRPQGIFAAAMQLANSIISPQAPIVVVQSGPLVCPKCVGSGWVHDSSMPHCESQSNECFFCDTCNTCRGKGIMMQG